jgi:hypothetical protein
VSAADPLRAAREAAAFAICKTSVCTQESCRQFADCGEQAFSLQDAKAAIAAFLRTPGLSRAIHDLMQRPENAGRCWPEVLAEAVEREGER